MRRFVAVVLCAFALASANRASAATVSPDVSRMRAEAARVTIVRDDWGIAHVHGKSDADAVFGAIYAQAEDDFNRIEYNYLDALGRRAEADGERAVFTDLRQRLFVDPADLRARYAASPVWLRKLMDAWADGLNYYLAAHPGVHPRVLAHFEPWMALSFTEGSIGGDIERISPAALRAFVTGEKATVARVSRDFDDRYPEPAGSNGIAIAPKLTAAGHALLLINPHTSFYFRSELQMTSDEGLNAYGASTWGQFFIYQGFNAHAGWMHTSSGVDNVDSFAETIVRKNERIFARYANTLRPVLVRPIVIAYRAADGTRARRRFVTYRTSHGPIVRSDGDRWIAIALMYKPMEALEQSFLRTKTSDYASFKRVARLQANSSNDTLFADARGEIAYMHPHFVPKRDDRFDYTQPVDGANPATDWQRLHTLDELPNAIDPPNGWVFNTNDWPYGAAGPRYSPKREHFPRYMDTAGENARGVHATLLLQRASGMTIDRLIATAYDPGLPAFAELVPTVLAAYDALPAADAARVKLAEPIAALRAWDDRWGADSVPTSLAVYWAEALVTDLDTHVPKPANALVPRLVAASPEEKLAALEAAVDKLTADFGTWQTPWGAINRYQRRDDALVAAFDDAKPSIPVPFVSGNWGSLASFGTVHKTTKKRYGTSGNSFVAVVEFGPRVRAKAVTAGGESGDPASKHFTDEARRYATGGLRDVYFYPEQLRGHTERKYHP